MNIVFVSYGILGNNSFYHMRGFAHHLSSRGHRAALIGSDISSISTGVDTDGVIIGTFEGIRRSRSQKDLREMLKDPATILHGWTSRELVRRFIEPLALRGLRYMVHLEDDETLVAASQLGVRPVDLESIATQLGDAYPEHLAHPQRAKRFVLNADGVTLISSNLAPDSGGDGPTFLLEPGVDTSFFAPKLSAIARRNRRKALGFDTKAIVIVYHGNIHRAIERDLFSLYTAIRILRRRGLDIHLLRTGISEQVWQNSTSFRLGEGVHHLGMIPRAEIPPLLDLADMYVQPGWVTPFNAKRLPSKLLEFLAMGRPVITAEVNLGTRLRDGHDAVLLSQGGANAIVQAVESLLQNPDKSRKIGRGGRLFAKTHFDWLKKTDHLEYAYRSLRPAHGRLVRTK